MKRVVWRNMGGCIAAQNLLSASYRNVATTVLTGLQEYSSQCVVCRLKIYGGLSTSPTKP